MIVVSEALANARSRIGLSGTVIAGLVAGMLAVAVVEFNEVGRTRSDAASLVRSGYTTLSVQPDSESRATVTAADCDRLARIPGVTSATWIRATEPTRMWSLRGPLVPTEHTGAGILDILAADRNSSVLDWNGMALITDAAGLVTATDTPGHRNMLIVDGGTSVSVDVLVTPLAIVGQAITGHLLMIEPPPPGPVTSCVALAALADRRAVAAAAQTAFPGTDGYTVRWVLPNADQFPDVLEQFQSRTAARLWIVVALASIGILSMQLRIRRNDYAFYRVAGSGQRRLFGLILCDLLILVTLAAAFSLTTLAATWLTRSGDGYAFDAAVAGTTRTVLAIALSAVLMAWYWSGTATSRALESLRD